MLGPTLAPGDLVVMENLLADTAVGVQQTIARRGAQLLYMPPYSPDLSPIDPYGSRVKMALHEAQARLREAPALAITDALATATEAKAHGMPYSNLQTARLARRLTPFSQA